MASEAASGVLIVLGLAAFVAVMVLSWSLVKLMRTLARQVSWANEFVARQHAFEMDTYRARARADAEAAGRLAPENEQESDQGGTPAVFMDTGIDETTPPAFS